MEKNKNSRTGRYTDRMLEPIVLSPEASEILLKELEEYDKNPTPWIPTKDIDAELKRGNEMLKKYIHLLK